jgi:hypothetical protein
MGSMAQRQPLLSFLSMQSKGQGEIELRELRVCIAQHHILHIDAVMLRHTLGFFPSSRDSRCGVC